MIAHTCGVFPCRCVQQHVAPSSTAPRRTAHDWEDLGLSVLAVLLAVLIAIIMLRKIIAATGIVPDVSMEADPISFE